MPVESANRIQIQSDFRGGLNQSIDPSQIADNEYYFLQNARVRTGSLRAIKGPVRQTDAPPGLYQGLRVVGNFLVLFCSGEAWYKDLSIPANNFTKLTPFLMDTTTPVIYSQLVPQSTFNQLRTAASPTDTPVLLNDYRTGIPGALVVQDGINRPRLIFADGSTRLAGSYEDWSYPDAREYVPIGNQMCYADGILYLVSADSKSVYRSVTGRPLDFVIAVDNSGNKVADATGLSFAVDYNPITCIAAVPGNNNSAILVSTHLASYIVTPDFTDTLYGEPTFNQSPLFETGAQNQFSFTTLTGDACLTDAQGLRSFNSTTQISIASNNDIFSKNVYPFFTSVVQDTTATVNFDNYALFAVKTIYGYGVVVHDLIKQNFVSFDQYTGVGAIKQFAVAKVGFNYRLFCITDDNLLFELFASDSIETATVYSKELTTLEASKPCKCLKVRAQFSSISTDGMVSATIIVDRQAFDLGSRTIKGNPTEELAPFPLTAPDGPSSEPLTWNLDTALTGYKMGVKLSWNVEAEINSIGIYALEQDANLSIHEQAKNFSKSGRLSS